MVSAQLSASRLEALTDRPFEAGTLVPASSIVQSVQGVDSSDGDLHIAGRDIQIHKHYHGSQPLHGAIDILSALRAIPNLRKVHLDILSKATAGTGVWLFKTDQWLLWLDIRGGIAILWGTGIRTSYCRSSSLYDSWLL